jgi:2-succinyl-6-hydroxy-2,4-cyclohexadiene-1-carboxylate synthase
MEEKHLFGKVIDCNGTNIQIYEGGNNSGDAIVFLHPQGSSSKIWENAITFFEKEYFVVLMDLRGHGESERAVSGYDIHTQCKDILSVLESLQINKVHLVGNSLGGDIATAFASIYQDKVLSLTNIDSGMIDYIGIDGERNQTKEQILEEFRNREMKCFTTKEELLEHVQSIFPKSLWDSYFEEWFKFVSIYEIGQGLISYQIPVQINSQIMAMVCDLQYKELYRNITCPILFLPAEKEDHLQTKLTYIEVASQYTKTKTKIIPHSKHLMILDQLVEVCKEIQNFLTEIRK